jgi:hypothetical protein
MRAINKQELAEILAKHVAWLRNEAGGVQADLSNANLYNANLRNANLRNATLPPFQLCPEGQFRAFKKLAGDIIAELLIPRSAQRASSLVGRKCRASKVKVVRLIAPDESHPESALDNHTGKLEYRVGCWVKPDKFDADIRVECTSGIHFFITREEAESY